MLIEMSSVVVFGSSSVSVLWGHLREWSTFGGLKRNRLFMTGGQSVYSLYVEVQGMSYV